MFGEDVTSDEILQFWFRQSKSGNKCLKIIQVHTEICTNDKYNKYFVRNLCRTCLPKYQSLIIVDSDPDYNKFHQNVQEIDFT